MTLKRDDHVIIQPWGIAGVVVRVIKDIGAKGPVFTGWVNVEYLEDGRITRQDFPFTRLEPTTKPHNGDTP